VSQLEHASRLAARLLEDLDTKGGIDEQSLAEKTAQIGELLQHVLDEK
jgi:hypothetical protein